MQSSSQKQFRITSIVFWVSLAAAVVAALFYFSIFSAVKSIGKGNASLKAQINTFEAEQSEVGLLQKDLATNQAREPILVSYFIDASDIVPFLETIEGYGRQTGVTVKFDTVDIKHSPDQLAVSLTSDGSFENIYRFIALVEAAPYELSVDSATVNSVTPTASTTAVSNAGDAASTTGSDTWEAQLSLSVTSITGVSDVPASSTESK